MEIQGNIIGIMPDVSGISKAGKPWRKCTYVLQTQGQYPKKLAFDLLNDRIDQFLPKMNEYVKVSFDVTSHEYNGKWFTNVTAWNVERPQYQQQPVLQQQPPQPQGQQQAAPQQQPAPPTSADPNLPF